VVGYKVGVKCYLRGWYKNLKVHKRCYLSRAWIQVRGGGLGSSTIFKKFNEPYAPSEMVLNDGA